MQTKKGADGKTLYILPPSLLASSNQPVGAKIAPAKAHTEAQKLRICIKDRNTSSPLPPQRSPDSASSHVGEAAPASSPQKRKESASRPTPREIEQDFAQLWSVWPIQQGKHDALHWFKRLSRAGVLPPLQVLLDTVEEFKRHDSRWRKGMIKLLSNWLSGRCWEDRPHSDTTTRANFAPEHCPPIGGAVAPKEASGQEALTAQNEPPQRLKPLPAVESATALRQLWPQQKQGEIGNLFRGLWSFLVSMRGVPPEQILGKAKAYLSETPNPDQLEYWLAKNRMSLLENAL